MVVVEVLVVWLGGGGVWVCVWVGGGGGVWGGGGGGGGWRDITWGDLGEGDLGVCVLVCVCERVLVMNRVCLYKWNAH